MEKHRTLIKSNPSFYKESNSMFMLEVSEMYSGTIQGEGINSGVPAVFLRLRHCTLSCSWCDTSSVWVVGNPYTFDELLGIMERVIEDLRKGAHFVLTGGSPLRQQKALKLFIDKFKEVHSFVPYIEVENECTLLPDPGFAGYVKCWNNSPKLENSGNITTFRYQPDVIKKTAQLPNSWFKFVITSTDDWKEIERDFLEQELIKREQIILMPEGATREELEYNREMVMDLCIRENVRYSDRLHILLWNRKTGV